MGQYMVEIKFSRDFTPQFMALIPKQRIHVNKLMQKNKLCSYVLSLERAKLWTIVNAETEEAVVDIIESFPLIDYLQFDVFSLTFNNQVVELPHISLN